MTPEQAAKRIIERGDAKADHEQIGEGIRSAVRKHMRGVTMRPQATQSS